MPPALEIAFSIGAVPLRRTGTALMRSASAAGVSALSGDAQAMRVSCNSAIAAGDSCAALRRNVDSDCLPRGRAEALRQISQRAMSGRRSMCRIASPEAAIASRNGADSA